MGKQRKNGLLLKIDGELGDLHTEYPEESAVEEIDSQPGEIVEEFIEKIEPIILHKEFNDEI